jgi:hypothetical protein
MTPTHHDHPLASLAQAGRTPRRARIGIAPTPVATSGQGAADTWRQHAASAVVGLALIAGGALASQPARAAAPGLFNNGFAVGGAAGSSDYGTAFKGMVGSGGTGMTFSGVPGLWRWEAQAQSYGSETYQQFGNSYKRNAWSAGVSVIPMLPVMPAVAAYAKLGVHYLSSHASGPGLSTSSTGFKPGLGAGVRWQAIPRASLRLEYENIGSSGGDVLSLGIEFPL